MYQRLKTHPYACYVLVLATLAVLIIFTTHARNQRPCLALIAEVEPQELRFLSQEQLLSLVSQYARRPLIGYPVHRLNLHEIEHRLSEHPYVKSVEIYRLHDASLAIRLAQKEPLARLSPPAAADMYLSAQGELLPLSANFTARVPVLRIVAAYAEAEQWHQPAHAKHALFCFLSDIHADPFWRAQVVALDLGDDDELRLYTQLSRQVVRLGESSALAGKLAKLYLFYKHVLPSKGWNKYRRVDLRFKNQIVCE